jgi:hypothetical protein
VVAEAHHNNKVQAHEYFEKIFRLLQDIVDLSSLQYIFHNLVMYLTILGEVTPANLEKVGTLGATCMKRVQAMGNELVLAQVNLSLSTLISHLVSMSYYTNHGSDADLRMVRSMSVTNLSHFQQIQHRKLKHDVSNISNTDSAKGGEDNVEGIEKTKYVRIQYWHDVTLIGLCEYLICF